MARQRDPRAELQLVAGVDGSPERHFFPEAEAEGCCPLAATVALFSRRQCHGHVSMTASPQSLLGPQASFSGEQALSCQ